LLKILDGKQTSRGRCKAVIMLHFSGASVKAAYFGYSECGYGIKLSQCPFAW
jgi:hypothetical protein